MSDVLDVVAAVGAGGTIVALFVVASRLRRSTGIARSRLLWLAWGILVTLTVVATTAVLSVLVDWPRDLVVGAASGCLVLPAAVALGRSSVAVRHGDAVLERLVADRG